MQHKGSFHLDEVRHIQDDEALRTVWALDKIPQATTLGDWLRRMRSQPQIANAWVQVNQAVLKTTLHHCKCVTLNIDATEIIRHKPGAQWTYNKNKGFMPKVGHIAETGQVVAADFRQGNIPPALANLEFIQQCQWSLAAGCALHSLRNDAPVVAGRAGAPSSDNRALAPVCDGLLLEKNEAIKSRRSPDQALSGDWGI